MSSRHSAQSEFEVFLSSVLFFRSAAGNTSVRTNTAEGRVEVGLVFYVAMVCREGRKGTSADDDDDDSLSLDIIHIYRMAAREENFQLCTSSPSGSILKFGTLP